MSLPETPGYVAGLERIVDRDHAQQYIALPGTGSRNGADYTAFQVDGVDYLQAGDYLCVGASGVPALWGGEGAYTTIQPDGYARWYQVGDLAGAALTVELPEEGGFWVYDANGAVTASSVAWGDGAAVLPEGGWIVFAGAPGARFHLDVSVQS